MAAKLTKPARDLGLDDLRYDVEVTGGVSTTIESMCRRYIGTLALIEGPWASQGSPGASKEYVNLHLTVGGRGTIVVTAAADAHVIVDRRPTPTTLNHFGVR